MVISMLGTAVLISYLEKQPYPKKGIPCAPMGKDSTRSLIQQKTNPSGEIIPNLKILIMGIYQGDS